ERGLRSVGPDREAGGYDDSRHQHADGALSASAELGEGEHGSLLVCLLRSSALLRPVGSDATLLRKVAGGCSLPASCGRAPASARSTSRTTCIYIQSWALRCTMPACSMRRTSGAGRTGRTH